MANRLFNYLVVFILMLISFVIGFNIGNKSSITNQQQVTPSWWEYQAEADNSMYFYGSSSAESEDIALFRAGNRAKQALIDYLNDEVAEESYSSKFIVSKLIRTNSELYYDESTDKNIAFVQYSIPRAILKTLKD